MIPGSVALAKKGEIKVLKFRIYEVKDGFSVWKLKDFGGGYAWEDTGRRFRTKDEAQKFIEKEGEKNDKNRKSD